MSLLNQVLRRMCLVAVGLGIFVPGSATAGPILYTSDFIADGSRSAFNGFEGAPATSIGPSSYVEDGISVDQINGDLNGIWTTCFGGSSCTAQEGSRSWYASGGDAGYTRITLQSGSDFQDLGLMVGSGFSILAPVYINYEVLLNGLVVLAGNFLLAADGNDYLGFGGGGFDEVRLSATTSNPQGVTSGAYQALQVDSIETAAPAVPEPATLLLLGTGLGAVARRRLMKRA